MLDMPDVFELEPTTSIRADESYIISYPHLLDFFATKATISAGDVVCGAHMVYGWMPTILDLYTKAHGLDLVGAAQLLNKARDAGTLTDADLQRLAGLINNSLVGASKLLHFVAPSQFAIWDSKVYTFVFGQRPYQNRVSDVTSYRTYHQRLAKLQSDHRFDSFYKSIKSKMGYTVSPLRALEVVMYLNAPVIG